MGGDQGRGGKRRMPDIKTTVKRRRFTQPLREGMRGVLVTCSKGRERRCADECLDLFEELTASNVVKRRPSVALAMAEGKSFQDMFEAELADLKAPKAAAEPGSRFGEANVNMDCVVFITFPDDVDPTALVMRILREVDETKKPRTVHCLRMVPVEVVVRATEWSGCEVALKEMVAKHFSAESPKSFAVVFNSRNSDRFERDDTIKRIAGAVGLPHKVNLSTPERHIVFENMMGFVLMSVVEEYIKLKKFNLSQIVAPLPTAPKSTAISAPAAAAPESSTDSKTAEDSKSSEKSDAKN